LSKSRTKIRALLADDHHIVREGIRQLLESAKDIEVIAEAGDGEEAQALIEQLKPDVAVLDIQMPKASGIGDALGAFTSRGGCSDPHGL
jgi:DNA-binding NarL/FixJ family response regulator